MTMKRCAMIRNGVHCEVLIPEHQAACAGCCEALLRELERMADEQMVRELEGFADEVKLRELEGFGDDVRLQRSRREADHGE